MSTAQEHADRIALALEAGPTPGPWEFGSYAGVEVRIGPFGCSKHAPFCVMTGRAAFPWNNTTESEQAFNDADFIASCDPAALTALLAERTALLEERAKIREALCCDEHDDQDPLVVIDMIRSWETDAQLKADSLAAHLRLVLEIADTWRPDYATKMDRDTIAGARAALKAKP